MIAANEIYIYGDVKPKVEHVPAPVIDCRTCAFAGMGACSLFPHQCTDGSAFKATAPIHFWSK